MSQRIIDFTSILRNALNLLRWTQLTLKFLLIYFILQSNLNLLSQDRVSEFELKLMDIESEHLGIPDTEYKCTVRLPAAEFQRIIRGKRQTCSQISL